MTSYEYWAWVDWHDPDDPLNHYHIGPYPTLDEVRDVVEHSITVMRRTDRKPPVGRAFLATATPEVVYERRPVVVWERVDNAAPPGDEG